MGHSRVAQARATEGTRPLDVVAISDAVLQSWWLLPLLLVMIAVDGPFPMLPSETLLMSAAMAAFGRDDTGLVVGLFLAATIGSVLGDLAVWTLGRGSHRLVQRGIDTHDLAVWVRRHMLARPGIVLVGARFLPGGRLVSTAAAGRFGLPARRFLAWSVASSAAWAAYMLLIGLALGPITGGDPVLCLVAGVVMALLTAGLFALAKRVQQRRAARV